MYLRSPCVSCAVRWLHRVCVCVQPRPTHIYVRRAWAAPCVGCAVRVRPRLPRIYVCCAAGLVMFVLCAGGGGAVCMCIRLYVCVCVCVCVCCVPAVCHFGVAAMCCCCASQPSANQPVESCYKFMSNLFVAFANHRVSIGHPNNTWNSCGDPCGILVCVCVRVCVRVCARVYVCLSLRWLCGCCAWFSCVCVCGCACVCVCEHPASRAAN